jgi:DNA-binding transcriptional regulator GbsR (MarR family)
MAASTTDWFVDEMGLTTEADGLTRIAGRLFGQLLLAAEPQSLDDIAAALGVSKASISTEARHLLDKGVVERTSKRGDRRDYYGIAPDFFESLMRYRVERWRKLRDLVAELQEAHPRQSAPVRARLEYMEEVYEYMTGHLDDALADWRAHNAKRRPARKPAAAGR